MAKSLSKYKEIKVSFCPNCKSYDVKYVFGLTNIFGIVPKMQCMECKISAPNFPILTTTKDALEKSKKERTAKKKSNKLLKKIRAGGQITRKKAVAKKDNLQSRKKKITRKKK